MLLLPLSLCCCGRCATSGAAGARTVGRTWLFADLLAYANFDTGCIEYVNPVAPETMPARASILSRLHLQGLRHFEAVVRLGTFEAAARELNVTPGAVSQQIRRLEDGLGVSLFHRYGNRSEPTDTARQIAQTLSDVFEQIEQALETGTGKTGSSSVKFKVYQTWANRWLIPRLEAFSNEYPDISVEFETGIESVDAGWGDLDMALSMRPDEVRLPSACSVQVST